MDYHKLDQMFDKLIVERRFDRAESLMLSEYESAKQSGDKIMLDRILARLAFTYSVSSPPKTERGLQCCIQREANMNTAYNKLQTGIFLHDSVKDYPAAAAKLVETIARGKEEEDDRTVYTSLNLLGRVYLELDRLDKATDILAQLEHMLVDKKPFVVGDETVFLESAFRRGIRPQSLKRFASALAQVCRDPEFRERLKTLSAK
jgi:hypothetical protein